MSNLSFLACVASAASTVSLWSLTALAQDASIWSELTRRDLAFIHDTLEQNHPGVIDDQNRAFRSWLESGYQAGLNEARQATSLLDATTILRRYAAGFADGHLGLNINFAPTQAMWPGFVASWNAGKFIVREKAERGFRQLPQKGWEISSCDGQRLEGILRDEVLPTYDARALQATRKKFAPFVLTRGLAASSRLVRQCTFERQEGPKTFQLEWNGIERSILMQKLRAASFGEAPQFGIDSYSPRKHFVSIPSFWPESESETQSLRSILEGVTKLRDEDLVVLDVRGNTGENSQWGDDILIGLFGKDYVERLEEQHEALGTFAEWRVSPANHRFLVSILPKLRGDFGESSPVYRQFHDLATRMERAVQDGIRFIRQSEPKPPKPPRPLPAYPIRAKIVLLTDGRCASACLDFADALRSVPGVVHVGEETSADTVYMDLRDVELPSKLGSLGFAMKVYRQRLRGNNEPHRPAHFFTGDISDTSALKAWLETLNL